MRYTVEHYEQAKRLLQVIQDGDHPLHRMVCESVTLAQLPMLIKLAEAQPQIIENV